MKFFVCSDIHSYYTPWMKALDAAGFNEHEIDHKIILCGDLFDRGGESWECYKFVKRMLENDKIIYVKGNHEQLLLDCCERGYPKSHDYSNGTVHTIWDLGASNPVDPYDFEECAKLTKARIDRLLKNSVNYYETEHYIFVHSWIPVISKDGLPAHYTKNRSFEYDPNWREASREDWGAATWGNPFDMAEKGLNQTGKIITFGHWHCSTGWANVEGLSEFGADAKFDPYYGDGIIGIDACTARNGKCNVIVLEDELLEVGNGNN